METVPANSAGEFHVTAASSGSVVINRGTTEIARFTSTGLAIGTTSPLTKFVASNGGAEGIELAPAYSAGNNFTFHINRSGSAYVTNSQVASAHIFRISSDATEAAPASTPAAGS
jgi:hypothetical protein